MNEQSVAILAQAISCSNERMIFLRHELFWFCLVQVSTTQFCWFPHAFMANACPFVDAEHANVPNSPLQDLSSKFGSLDGFVPDLERVGARSTSSMEERFEAIFARKLSQFEVHLGALASIPMLVQARFENRFLSLTQLVAIITNKISSVEQVVGGLAARVAASEVGAVSPSSVPGSAGSWPLAGQVDGSTAAGSHDPVSGIQDADLINCQVQITVFLRTMPCWRVRISKRHLFQPMCQTESTAKQEPHELDHRDDGLP